MRIVSFLLSLLLPIFIYAGPIVTSVSPSNGPTAGGNIVQISGSGFSGVTAINFGTVPVATFTVVSTTVINVTAPASIVAGTIDVTVTTGSGTSAVSPDDQYTYAQGDWYLYASTTGSPNFWPVNLRTNTIGTPLTVQDVSLANAQVITPNGQLDFMVPRSFGDLINVALATGQDLPVIPIGSSPINLATAPGGKTVYITITSPNGIQVLDIASDVLGFIPLPDTPMGIAVSSDGLYAYVTTINGVFPVNLKLGIVEPIITAPRANTIQITPDGTHAFLDNPTGINATFIDLRTRIAFNTIPIGVKTIAQAVNPNGKTVYYISFDFPFYFLYPVDIATLAVGTPLQLLNGGIGLSIAPDGNTAYVVTTIGVIQPIDLITFTRGLPITLDNLIFTESAAISPDPAPIASFTVVPALSGFETIFDATNSLSPVGTIVQYAWDFGDGNTLTTSLPVVAHVYESSGTFTVVLTVTNSAGTSTTQVFTGQTMSRNGGPSARTSQEIQILSLFPPANVKGFQIERKFLMQEEIQNKIVWDAPTGGIPPVAYYIYADAALQHLVAIIPAGDVLKFVQHNVFERDYTFYIISVDADGNQSLPVTVRIFSDSE